VGWILTIIGPALYAVRGWLPGAGVFQALKVGVYLVGLGLASWGGVALGNWWHSDKITLAESGRRCVDSISIATLEAKIAALDGRDHLLRQREEQVASDEEAVAAAIAKMERDRAETARAGDDGVLVRADDEWLRRWRGPKASTGGGGR